MFRGRGVYVVLKVQWDNSRGPLVHLITTSTVVCYAPINIQTFDITHPPSPLQICMTQAFDHVQGVENLNHIFLLVKKNILCILPLSKKS